MTSDSVTEEGLTELGRVEHGAAEQHVEPGPTRADELVRTVTLEPRRGVRAGEPGRGRNGDRTQAATSRWMPET